VPAFILRPGLTLEEIYKAQSEYVSGHAEAEKQPEEAERDEEKTEERKDLLADLGHEI